jgi:cytochrome b6-f complex iron-sulfur subunit
MAIVYKDGKPVVVGQPEPGDEDEDHSPQEPPVDPELTRRRFMRATFLGSMTAFTIGAGGTFLLFFWPKKVGTFGSKIAVGNVVDFLPGSVTKIADGRFWLTRMLPEDGGDGFMALYWKCVHLGCTVPWSPDENGSYNGKNYKGIFHCPCHGSLYLYNGQNFGGPAPRPLDFMEITISGGKIAVDTSKITKRDKHDPKSITKV